LIHWHSEEQIKMHRELVLMGLMLLCGCGGEQAFRKETHPVTGAVTVNGKVPDSPIQVECHPLEGFDTEHPSISACETDSAGKFTISTYESGDGVPAGEYVLTFKWQEFNLLSREYSGPDKLKDRYSDPLNAQIKLSVEAGKPKDMGTIDLKVE
jgi:hypothetical protein